MIARHIFGAALLFGLAACGAATAQEPNWTALCGAPENLYEPTDPIGAAHAAVAKQGALAIVVLGTASSSAQGLSAPANAYPERLKTALGALLPKVKVTVALRLAPRRSAAEMVGLMRSDVLPLRPDLVVWQTGTVDAVRGVDAETFAQALLMGIDTLHRAGISVILMDMQYSPYTGSMVSLDSYRRRMTWVSQVSDVTLFRRYDIMEYWYRNGNFDFEVAGAAAQLKMADRVHGCIGRLLAETIAIGVEQKDGMGK